MKALLLIFMIASLCVHGKTLSLDKNDFSKSPYGKMHMLFEKTFLQIDVMNIDVYFKEETANKIKDAVKNDGENKIKLVAAIAMGAKNVLIVLNFLRDISFERFIEAIESKTECAYSEEYINKKEFLRVKSGLSKWFAPLKDRGVKEGDTIYYRIKEDTLRTVYITGDGKKGGDKVDHGRQKVLSVLASYFAKCSEYRDPLIKSVF